MAQMRYTVEATYRGCKYAKKPAICKAAKRIDDGSGTDLTTGEHDITFSFYQRPAAERAVKRISKIRGVKARILPAGYLPLPC